MLTRRHVVVGAGLGAIAALGTAIELGPARRQRLLDDVGLSERAGPDTHVAPSGGAVSGMAVSSGEFKSVHMGRSVGWSISNPSRPPLGVIYCLHGLGGNHRFAFDQIHLPDVVEAQQAALAIAAVDGGHDSYWHARADGTDALAMVLDEFMPLVEQHVPVTNRAVLGWSMGGYGALLAAERAPGRFLAVAAASPALWTSAGQTAPGAFDGPADYQRFDVFGLTKSLTGLTVRVDCGTSDPFYQATRQFVTRLPAGQQVSFGPGSHDSGYWRSVAGAQVTTIAAALSRQR